MNSPDQNDGGFHISVIPAEERDKPCEGVSIEYGGVGYAEYSRGSRFDTLAGDIIDPETAELDVISVSGEPRQGVGTKLLARMLEEARRDEFKYARMFILNPLIVKMVERALKEGRIADRAYRPFQTGDLFDLPSGQLLEDAAVVTPEEAIDEIGRALKVECVIKL